MLAKKTCVFVLTNQRQKLLNAPDPRCWRVAVPLQIGSHPVDLPESLSLDEGGLCNGILHSLTGLPLPAGANLEYFNALPVYTKGKVELRSDMRRRTMLVDEIANDLFQAFGLEFAYGHVSRSDVLFGA